MVDIIEGKDTKRESLINVEPLNGIEPLSQDYKARVIAVILKRQRM